MGLSKVSPCVTGGHRMGDSKVDMELLEKEYFHIQSEIESFDEKSLTIKAWSVTLAGAIAGSSAFTDNKMVILFASIVSLMFWFIDGAWKTFQYANYRRIVEIEDFMRGDIDNIVNLQIAKSWNKSYHKGGTHRLAKIMLWPHVILPHGAMFIFMLLVYLSYSFK
ncbi:hypothetical protein ElyMa_003361000 [Elysia marginata]|uniref:Essential for reactive oxygen species protein n=1 Tax=Elysia marginata TaxID=1093978 RepID=A0AAV4JHT2_9GAST|nr:hypothetical protein ElyMa_003361000 [Elysia marginata]